MALVAARPGWAARAEEDEKPRGKIFVYTLRAPREPEGPVSGTVAIDAGDGFWAEVARSRPAIGVSTDGRFVYCINDGNGPAGTWSVDLKDGGDPLKIADERAHGAWSTDDGKILLSVAPTAQAPPKAQRMNPDGSGREGLPIPESDEVIDASAGGRWLLTVSDRGAPKEGSFVRTRRAIYLMRPEGKEERLVIEAGRYSATHRLSPDGRMVVYDHFEGDTFEGEKDFPKASLRIVGTDGKGHRTLVQNPAGERLIQAVWSPDSKRLAALWVRWPDVGEGETKRLLTARAICRIDILDLDGKVVARVPAPEAFPFLLVAWR